MSAPTLRIPIQAKQTFKQDRWMLLDLGNSRLKVRVISQGAVQYSFSELHLQSPLDLLIGLMPALSNYPLHGIAIASVLGSEDNVRIDALLQKLNAPIHFCQVKNLPILTSLYNTSLLGVDRWLQMLALAARSDRTNFVVIGCGSALTIDIIEKGQHLGGYILPSLFLQRQALLDGTRKIKVDAPVFSELTPATNTHAAVHNGIALGLVATIDYVAKTYHSHRIILCGGDAPLFYQLINPKEHSNLYLEQNELVLEGLVMAVDYCGSFV